MFVMKNKNEDVKKLVEEFGLVYEKYCKLNKEVESELEYWNEENNWSEEKFSEDENYSMSLYVMKECLEGKN